MSTLNATESDTLVKAGEHPSGSLKLREVLCPALFKRERELRYWLIKTRVFGIQKAKTEELEMRLSPLQEQKYYRREKNHSKEENLLKAHYPNLGNLDGKEEKKSIGSKEHRKGFIKKCLKRLKDFDTVIHGKY